VGWRAYHAVNRREIALALGLNSRSSKGDFAVHQFPALSRGFSPNQELLMPKFLVVLAIAGTMSVPVAAQTAQTAPAASQAQPAKPQMVKKRVCQESEDNPYSRLKTKTCKTIMVPAEPSTASGQQAPAQTPPTSNGQ
jgi:hypothetical protein